MIFGKIYDEPWYGENASLVQRVATGPGDVELGGGALLPVPGAVATEVHRVGLVGVFEAPQRSRGGHHEAKGVGPDNALDLPALVLAQTVERMTVPNGDFDGPAVTILPEDVFPAEGEICGEKGFDWGTRLALARLLGAGGGWATDHDHTHQPPRQDRMPEADPGLDLCLGFRWMRLPAPALAGQGFGGTQ